MTEEIIKKLAKEKDDYIMRFLKSKGYRPKPTTKYITNLMYRLKRKGLVLKFEEYTDYSPMKDNVISGTVKMLCFIDKIDKPILKGNDMKEMLKNWKY